MIHPSLQGADYQPLQVGDPIFLRFTGEVICYEGVEGVCPVFVNEAAYYDTFAAFTLMKKIQITRGS
jgi:aspartoacylase